MPNRSEVNSIVPPAASASLENWTREVLIQLILDRAERTGADPKQLAREVLPGAHRLDEAPYAESLRELLNHRP